MKNYRKFKRNAKPVWQKLDFHEIDFSYLDVKKKNQVLESLSFNLQVSAIVIIDKHYSKHYYSYYMSSSSYNSIYLTLQYSNVDHFHE